MYARPMPTNMNIINTGHDAILARIIVTCQINCYFVLRTFICLTPEDGMNCVLPMLKGLWSFNYMILIGQES